MLSCDHIGIQVANLKTSEAWYSKVFVTKKNWELNRFSDLTQRRLGGIAVLTELEIGGLKFHIFERSGISPSSNTRSQFQHIGVGVSGRSEMENILTRARDANEELGLSSEITEIVVDNDGTLSVYLSDPDGNEYELTCKS